MRDLAEPVRRFKMAKEDFLAVIDGMEMDIDETIRAPVFETLDLYCDRVASAVGRLSANIFGMEDAPGKDLAYNLGRALQFTNILRDLDEDAEMGRLYLPAEALVAAGIETREPAEVLAHPSIDAACRWLADRARQHYAKADKVMADASVGRLRAARLMSGVYGAILKRMTAKRLEGAARARQPGKRDTFLDPRDALNRAVRLRSAGGPSTPSGSPSRWRRGEKHFFSSPLGGSAGEAGVGGSSKAHPL